MRIPALALLCALLLAGCADKSPASGDKAGSGETLTMTSYYLEANLTPPVTTYVVRVSSLFTAQNASGLPEDFTWTNSNGCGRFTPSGGNATWYHGEDTNCSHDSPVHPGTITVVMGGLSNATSSTGYATCEYTGGSASGRSPPCYVSSVAPAGKPAARHTSIPAPGLGLLVAVAALAALGLRKRG